MYYLLKACCFTNCDVWRLCIDYALYIILSVYLFITCNVVLNIFFFFFPQGVFQWSFCLTNSDGNEFSERYGVWKLCIDYAVYIILHVYLLIACNGCMEFVLDFLTIFLKGFFCSSRWKWMFWEIWCWVSQLLLSALLDCATTRFWIWCVEPKANLLLNMLLEILFISFSTRRLAFNLK